MRGDAFGGMPVPVVRDASTLAAAGEFMFAELRGFARSAAFVVQGRLRDDDGPVRIGFTVTKKNGTATERNRIRRRLRELVKRLDVISMRPHHDYVLVGRRAALTRDFATMLDDLRSALHRLDRQPATTSGASRKPN